jgi:hypothetical protein
MEDIWRKADACSARGIGELVKSSKAAVKGDVALVGSGAGFGQGGKQRKLGLDQKMTLAGDFTEVWFPFVLSCRYSSFYV